MFKPLQYLFMLVMLLLCAFKAGAQLAMPDYVCIGATKYYNVDPNPVPGSTYTWKIDGVTQASSTTNAIYVTWNATGIYLLEVQELSASQCLGLVQSGEVFVNAAVPASVNILSDKTGVCISTLVNLTAVPVNGGITPSYQWRVNGTNVGTGNSTYSYIPANGDLVTVLMTSTATCVSGSTAISNEIRILVQNPSAPMIGTIIHPTCSMATGSVVLSGLPSGAWTINPGGIGGTGTSTTITGLTAGTYNYMVTDASGCSSTPSSDVVIRSASTSPESPVASVTIQPTCTVPTGTIVITSPVEGSGYTYSNDDGTIWVSTTTYTGLKPGNYSLKVKETATGCVSPATGLTVNSAPGTPPAPSANITAQPNCTVSTGAIVVTSPIGAIYEYSSNGTTWQSTTTFNGLAANTTYTISVRSTVNPTCISTSNFVINEVPNVPAAPAATLTQPTCAVTTGTIVVTSPLGVNLQYSGNGTTWQRSTTFSGLTPNATYTISVRSKVNPTCISASNFVINAVPIVPHAPIVGSITQPTCSTATGSVELSGLPSSGNWILTRTPDGVTTKGTSIRITLSGLSAETYTFTVIDEDGCSSTPSGIVIIKSATGPDTILTTITNETCGAANGALSLGLVTGGTAPYTSSVDGGAFTQTTKYNNLTAGSHTIDVKDNNDCIYSTTAVLLNVSGPTNIAVSITDETCGSSNGELSLGTVTAGSPPFTYSVDGSSFTGSTQYMNLSAGLHTIDVKDKNGCDFSTTITIARPPATSAKIKGDTAICAGSPIPLTIEMTGIAPWSVTYTDGINNVPLSNIMSSPYSFNVSPTTNTTYTLTSVTDANCTDTLSESAIIAVTSRVNPAFTQPGPFLQNTVAPILPRVSLNGISGQWSPVTISTTESGISTYTFTPDSSECALKTTLAITINIQAVIEEKDSLPTSSIIHSGACQRISLDGSKSIGNIVSYQWSSLDKGGYLTQQSGVTTEFELSNDYDGSLPADFRIRLIVTDNNGYTDSDTITVNVDRFPVADVTSSGTLQTDGSMIVDGSVSIGTDISYKWSTSKGKIVGPDNAPTAKFIGAGMYSLKITDIYGCQSIKDFKISPEVYRIVANPDYYRITWAQDTALNVLANDSLPPGYNSIRVLKQPTLGKTSVNSDLTINYSPTTRKPGHDQLEYEVCNIDLCDSATVTIDIDNSNLIIPQGFSPNGDEVNDVLKFDGLDKYKPSELTIYTRSGQQVFTSSDYHNEWNGTMANYQPVPTGVYYYVLKLGQTNRIIKGFIYIGY